MPTSRQPGERRRRSASSPTGTIPDRPFWDAFPDAVAVVNMQGRVLEWNSAAERLFGYNRKQTVGRNLAALLLPGVESFLREEWDAYVRLGPGAYVGRMRQIQGFRSDGLEVAVELAALVVPDSRPPVYLCQMRDVTERERKMAAYTDFYVKMQSYHQSTARTMAALSRDLDIANVIQRAALPPSAPEIVNWDIAFRYEFAQEVGGDFCLFVEDGNRVNIAVGDVSGKGVPAALTSTSVTHLLPWLLKTHSPAETLDDLNRDLLALLPTEQFATLVLAALDPDSGKVALWNAGHPPAIKLDSASGLASESTISNPLLGVFSGWRGEEETMTLQVGDAVMLCTDGILEARNESGEEFGSERCGMAMARFSNGDAAEIAGAVLEEVRTWGHIEDDITLVVCKYCPE